MVGEEKRGRHLQLNGVTTSMPEILTPTEVMSASTLTCSWVTLISRGTPIFRDPRYRGRVI
jgi:hypothetical protein